MATINYTPGQILYVKSKYDEAYISVIAGTSHIPQNEGILIHTCCDLTIREYEGNMYDYDVNFARRNGTMLDVDVNFEEIREATTEERGYLYKALVQAFKEHELGWDKYFTDSTYDDIRDWLCWEFDIDLENMDDNNPLGVTIYEITNYIWDVLCKETGNYQACTDYVEPEMVNKQEFIAKVKRWLELETDWDMEYDEEGRNDNYGKIDELVKYLEE